MDFHGNGYMRNKSIKFLEFAGEVGNMIGARRIVTHIGPYNGLSSKDAMDRLVPIFQEMRNHYLEKGYSAQICFELAGKHDLFGSIREITE